jgi:glutathione S-transferase
MAQDGFTLYGIAPSGPTYKVALMLSLCGQRFSYRHMNFMKGAHNEPGFLAINRYGQLPALEHGGLLLCQSGAILEYLAETLGKFGGRGAEERQRCREWVFWDADRLSPGIYRSRAIVRGFAKADPAAAAAYREHAEAGLKVLNDLVGGAFLVGAEPTIADVAAYGAVAFAGEGEFDLGAYPNVAAWAERVRALPGFKAPYDLLPMHDIP